VNQRTADNSKDPQSRQDCVVTIMGPPGSGKGTQADIVERDFGFSRIETGAILRAMRHEDSERARKITEIIDAGLLAPPPIVADLVIEKTLELLREGKRVIFDGSPRTLYEAERLYEVFEKNSLSHLVVISINVPKEETVARIVNRLVCSKCKSVVTGTEDMLQNGTCDTCGGTFKRRADDTPEIMKRRWQQFLFRTEPVINYFRSLNIVHEVDGSGSIEAIAKDVAKIIHRECSSSSGGNTS
jgi:adenylate kinase